MASAPLYRLTVKEVDGAPSVSGVRTIRVDNGTLTDDGNGQVTIDFPAAAPGGSDTQLQYNNAGAFAGAASLTHAASGTHLTVTAQAATDVPLAARAATSQSAPLAEFRNSAGAVVSRVSSAGSFDVRGVSGDDTVGFRMLRSSDANPILKVYEISGQIYIDNSGLTLNFNGSGNFSFGSTVQFSGNLTRSGGNGVIFFGSGGAAPGTYIRSTFATAPGLQVDASSGHTAPIQIWADTLGNTLATVSNGGYFTTRKTAAPADAELANSEAAYWLDATPGATKIKFKAKDSGGTVRTGEVALS
jgi:hypothetical protein